MRVFGNLVIYILYNYNANANKTKKNIAIQKMTRRQEPQPSSRNPKITPSPLSNQPKMPPTIKMMGIKTMMPMIANTSISTLFDFQVLETHSLFFLFLNGLNNALAHPPDSVCEELGIGFEIIFHCAFPWSFGSCLNQFFKR